MECTIVKILPSSKGFEKICAYLESVIVSENLSINGGTLNYSNLTYESNLLLLAIKDEKPIGFSSLVELEDSFYVYQIAIKKEYQQKGIGSMLLEEAIGVAKSVGYDVTANVMEHNTNSKKMFERFGFKKLGYSSKGNAFYRFFQPEKIVDQQTNIDEKKH